MNFKKFVVSFLLLICALGTLSSCEKKQDVVPCNFFSEIIIYSLKPSITEAQHDETLQIVNKELSLKYSGFIERTTSKISNGKYIDIVFWKDSASCETAIKDASSNEVLSNYIEMIDPETMQQSLGQVVSTTKNCK